MEKNCLYFSKSDFPVLTVMDEPIQFTRDISRAGLKYLESAQSFPIRGNGFCFQGMIHYLLDQEIITSDQIKYVFYASCSIPKISRTNLLTIVLTILVNWPN